MQGISITFNKVSQEALDFINPYNLLHGPIEWAFYIYLHVISNYL